MNRAHEIIASLREEIGAAPSAELPAIIGQIEAVKAEAFAKMLTPSTKAIGHEEDRFLTPKEVAARLGETSRWVRDHAGELNARVDLPGRTLRFSEHRIGIFMRNRARQRG